GRFGRLNFYQHHDNSVILSYELDFSIDGTTATVQVGERYDSVSEILHESAMGWARSGKVWRVPEGFEAVVLQSKLPNQIGRCELFPKSPGVKWREVVL